MYRTIAEHKNKHTGRHAIIVGTGPSADNLDIVVAESIRRHERKPILICVNRSICLRNDFDYLFTDAFDTLREMKGFLGRSKYICLPFWSREKLNLGGSLISLLRDRILFYALVWDWAFLKAQEYSLNDILLFINWGCVQPAIHFAFRTGIKNITLIGCEGKTVDGKTMSDKVKQTFNMKPASAKKQNEFGKTREGIDRLVGILPVNLDFYEVQAK